ncbi:hypothetical protein [Microbacterium sp. cx-59]|uniref:hypothetical protein n=1 Tax=Microbacterium sp. cx-59 TaxID=2891207 RepID=UPI001E4FBF44|nr:hypothetical protein [Microbacterium sp. cx-59]MCC4906973.1 hypothetical protein [Microbacterium sp. cx-59]
MAGKRPTVEPQPGEPYTQDRFGYRHPLVVPTASGAVSIPEGSPTDVWTNAQLDAYAEREGIELAGSKNKTDRLTKIGAHQAAKLPALPPE